MAPKKSGKLNNTGTHASDDELKKLIGARIARVRARCGFSGKRAALASGINRSVLSQIEHGRVHINAVSLLKLAYALGCPTGEFFPVIPETTSLTESDVALMAKESDQAAAFLQKAFRKK